MPNVTPAEIAALRLKCAETCQRVAVYDYVCRDSSLPNDTAVALKDQKRRTLAVADAWLEQEQGLGVPAPKSDDVVSTALPAPDSSAPPEGAKGVGLAPRGWWDVIDLSDGTRMTGFQDEADARWWIEKHSGLSDYQIIHVREVTADDEAGGYWHKLASRWFAERNDALAKFTEAESDRKAVAVERDKARAAISTAELNARNWQVLYDEAIKQRDAAEVKVMWYEHNANEQLSAARAELVAIKTRLDFCHDHSERQSSRILEMSAELNTARAGLSLLQPQLAAAHADLAALKARIAGGKPVCIDSRGSILYTSNEHATATLLLDEVAE